MSVSPLENLLYVLTFIASKLLYLALIGTKFSFLAILRTRSILENLQWLLFRVADFFAL